jgi:serine/threonine-protein kinase
MASVFQRLRQRKIVEWAIAYVAGAWLLLELLGFVAENFAWPTGIVRGATVFLGIGFLVTLVLAWYHGEKGQQRVTGPELLIVAGLLLVAGAAAAYVSRDASPEESESGATPTHVIDPRSIAILPFANRSAGGENAAFFAEGMHDDILTTLARIGSLKVISRTSAMKYRATEKSIPEIAGELGVATVLEGGVQRAGDRVRLNVQLIDAETDRHIWAETYDEELTTANIFSIHSDIARKIATALEAKLAPDVAERIEVQPTESLEAYDLYTRGRYLANRSLTRGDAERAAELYRQAIAADPAYAPAYAGLAGTYLLLWGQGFLAADEALLRARAAVERALELDEALAEAHAALGSVLVGELRFEDAEREFERALKLNHGSADVHLQYGQLLLELARNAEAVRQARQAVELDPLSIANRLFLAASLMFARDNDASITESLRILELEPENSVAHYVLALGFTLADRHEEGLAAIRRSIELDPEDLLGPPLLAWVYARAGQREEALKTLERVEEQGPILREIAIVHGELGDMDRAFAYLDRAFADDPGNLSYLKADPTADSLRDDPRFAELLKKLGLE